MNEERLLQVLLSPHISEKSTMVGEQSNQVIFKVLPSAKKKWRRESNGGCSGKSQSFLNT